MLEDNVRRQVVQESGMWCFAYLFDVSLLLHITFVDSGRLARVALGSCGVREAQRIRSLKLLPSQSQELDMRKDRSHGQVALAFGASVIILNSQGIH